MKPLWVCLKPSVLCINACENSISDPTDAALVVSVRLSQLSGPKAELVLRLTFTHPLRPLATIQFVDYASSLCLVLSDP